MNNPREDGLSSQEEFDTLQKFEDSLIKYVSTNSGGIYAGRLTTDGKRDFYFYVSNSATLESNVSNLMAAYKQHSYALKSIIDSNFASVRGYSKSIKRRMKITL